jgi:hypothetical protein
MGCATSRMAAVPTNQTGEKMMQNLMQNLTQMQQENLARQQQIMQDDPECKELMDRSMAINQKVLAAFQSGDQAALARAQSENLELQKHPKYMKMMMPTNLHTKVFKSHGKTKTTVKNNQEAFATTSDSMNMFAFSGGSGAGSTPSGFDYGGGVGEASMPSSGFDNGGGGAGAFSGFDNGGGGGSSMFTDMAQTMADY